MYFQTNPNPSTSKTIGFVVNICGFVEYTPGLSPGTLIHFPALENSATSLKILQQIPIAYHPQANILYKINLVFV